MPITTAKLRKLYLDRRYSLRDIAAEFDVTTTAISQAARAIGLPMRGRVEKGGRIPQPADSHIKELWESGWKTREIAEATGYNSRQAVRRAARRLGLPARAQGAVPKADSIIAEMWVAGVRTADIAHETGHRDPGSINRAADRLGLPKRSRKGLISIAEYRRRQREERLREEWERHNQKET